MAKIELPAFIKSISGTISKKTLSDGTVVRFVVTKNNRLHLRTESPHGAPSTEQVMAKQVRFGTIARAVTIVRKELQLSTDPETRKRLWAQMGIIYDRLQTKGKTITPETMATLYAYLEW